MQAKKEERKREAHYEFLSRVKFNDASRVTSYRGDVDVIYGRPDAPWNQKCRCIERRSTATNIFK